MFRSYVLRTTNAPAARAFYAEAIGLVLPEGTNAGSALGSWPLHEQAIARGAKPHWLGQLAVDDVDAIASQLIERGSQPYGPTMRGRDGAAFATLRDPFGSMVGLRAREPKPVDTPIVWHQLHTTDVDAAWALYRELFGWSPKHTVEHPSVEGGIRLFAWNDAGAPVGCVANTARLPGVATHWLFYHPVADLDRAIAGVRANGGAALHQFELEGIRFAACDDPQGAAFGLAQLR
jgi:predicted enzyme related to lactoylglutathione lyase